jgi:hypothetical protein
VSCARSGEGWRCSVSTGTTQHVVTVSLGELMRFAPGNDEPTRLLEESFRFVLERESASSILRQFAISEIERYFPDYPGWITDKLTG